MLESFFPYTTAIMFALLSLATWCELQAEKLSNKKYLTRKERIKLENYNQYKWWCIFFMFVDVMFMIIYSFSN